MESVDLAVLGMTFAGAGAALSCPGSALVLEAKAMPGYEFLDCIRPIPALTGGDASLCGGLIKDFFDAGLADCPFSPGWTPYFSEFLLENNCDVRFFTDVIAIDRQAGGFLLTLCRNGEKSALFAKKVIDTRTAEPSEVCLRGCIFSPEPVTDFNGLQITDLGRDMYTFSLRVSAGTTVFEAREQFFSLFRMRPAALSAARILTVADVFACRSGYCRRVLSDGVLSLPSDYSPDLFDAFRRGMEAYND